MPAEPSTTSDVDANTLWGDDWPEVRALWPLEPTVAHVNHGSYGAVPTPVLEEQQSWRDRMETNPLRFLRREAPAALVAARAEVAGFLGAGPTSLAFVHNATSGASTVFSSCGHAWTMRPMTRAYASASCPSSAAVAATVR